MLINLFFLDLAIIKHKRVDLSPGDKGFISQIKEKNWVRVTNYGLAVLGMTHTTTITNTITTKLNHSPRRFQKFLFQHFGR